MHRNTKADLKKLGIDPKVLKDRTYVLNPKTYDVNDRIVLDAYKIREECLSDLIEHCKSQKANYRQRKIIDLAEQVIKLYSLPDPGYTCKYLSKLSREKFIKEFDRCVENKSIDVLQGKKTELLNLRQYLDKLQTGEVQLPLFKGKGKNSLSLKELYQKTKREIRQKEIELQNNGFYSNMTKIFVDELVSMPLSDLSEVLITIKLDVCKRVMSRYNPSFYDPKSFGIRDPPEYVISVCDKKRELSRAVKIADACLSWKEVRNSIDDEGTINLVLRKDGEIAGYERIFLMTTKKGEPVLGIDNLEVGRKNFNKHTDSIKAMGLAAIQLGLDCNAKYVIGEDARVKYGPRQAYGNKEKKVRLTQINIPSMSPHYRIRQDHTGTVYVLMENWRFYFPSVSSWR